MKKWLIIIGLLLLLFTAGFVVMLKVIMPKAAIAFVPVKWQNIPLGEKRIVLHEYLDKPLSVAKNTDHWEEKLGERKKYTLDIGYGPDSIAKNYSILYKIKLLGFSDVTTIKIDSIP